MKKIMFNDKFHLTQSVLDGTKTMTRRLLKEGTPLGNWEETEKSLPYKVGEIVAIAQSYHTLNKSGYVAPEWCEHTCESSAGYENKMFVRADLMPHHIRITDVKVERLQDISDDDCLREGVWQFYDNKNLFYISKNIGYAPDVAFLSAREAFWHLIDKISGNGTWESNPWMVAYSFERMD